MSDVIYDKGRSHYPINAPQKPLIDYEKNKKVLSEERKKEYNDLIEKVISHNTLSGIFDPST